MPDIIDLLERIGRDPALRDNGDELAQAVAAAGIDPAQQAAILAGDDDELRGLLGSRPMFALQMPAEEQPDDEHEPGDGDDDDDDEGPDDDGRTHLGSAVAVRPA